MTVSVKYIILAAFCMLLMSAPAGAQGTDRRDVRKGNRDFRKENYKAAEIDYRKALVKDSTSFAAVYNLGNTLYRMEDRQQAGKIYEKLGGVAAASPYASDYYYNVGNVAVSAKDWQAAVEAYRQSLLRTWMPRKTTYTPRRCLKTSRTRAVARTRIRTRTRIRIRTTRTEAMTRTGTGMTTRTVTRTTVRTRTRTGTREKDRDSRAR